MVHPARSGIWRPAFKSPRSHLVRSGGGVRCYEYLRLRIRPARSIALASLPLTTTAGHAPRLCADTPSPRQPCTRRNGRCLQQGLPMHSYPARLRECDQDSRITSATGIPTSPHTQKDEDVRKEHRKADCFVTHLRSSPCGIGRRVRRLSLLLEMLCRVLLNPCTVNRVYQIY